MLRFLHLLHSKQILFLIGDFIGNFQDVFQSTGALPKAYINELREEGRLEVLRERKEIEEKRRTANQAG